MKAAIDFSFSLVLAIIIGLAILVLGVKIFGNFDSERFPAAKGNMAAYMSLKTSCTVWREALDQCPNCDCNFCKDQFVNAWLKIYHVPYWAYLANLSSSTFCANGCPQTTACISAVSRIADPQASTSEVLAKFGNALEQNDLAKYLKQEVAPPCAEVCAWVVLRGEACSLSAANCAAPVRQIANMP